jgi:hypothetical protein
MLPERGGAGSRASGAVSCLATRGPAIVSRHWECRRRRLAACDALALRWAPIEFGALWAAVFTVLGVRLHALDANTPPGA